MPAFATRFRFISDISTLITTVSDARVRDVRNFYSLIDVPVQIYIEDTIRRLLVSESVVRVHRHIELVSEHIASHFQEDFDFDTSVFHQQEKAVRSKIWQPRKQRILQLHPA